MCKEDNKEIIILENELKSLYEKIEYLEECLHESDQEIIMLDLYLDEVKNEYKKFMENKGILIDDGIYLSI